jgi:hypothetical protein
MRIFCILFGNVQRKIDTPTMTEGNMNPEITHCIKYDEHIWGDFMLTWYKPGIYIYYYYLSLSLSLLLLLKTYFNTVLFHKYIHKKRRKG